MTHKPPITTYFSPTALALAMTPLRSGSVGSSGDMAGSYGSGQHENRLVGEFLALFDSLGRGGAPFDGALLLGLFSVDFGPTLPHVRPSAAEYGHDCS